MGYMIKLSMIVLSFVLMAYLLGYGNCDTATAPETCTETGLGMLIEGDWNTQNFVQLTMQSIINTLVPATIVGVGVFAISGATSLLVFAVLGTLVAGTLLNLLLSPIALITNMNLPEPFGFFIIIVFNIFIIIAATGFVVGRD